MRLERALSFALLARTTVVMIPNIYDINFVPR